MKPLLLFFLLGFSIPIVKIPFEFPESLYQGLNLYLLVSIGWHGGEELAILGAGELAQAAGFMLIGIFTNTLIGLATYFTLLRLTRLRRIDAAAVAGFYGSDSAGTFMTCVAFLGAAQIAYAAYMPVLLAVMEIPGCLVALFLVSRLRKLGMDAVGNLPDEDGYQGAKSIDPQMNHAIFSLDTFREVFLNPGLYLLFGGLLIGFLSRRQGTHVTAVDDVLFVNLFQGLLCLFLLEMGITAAKRLQDLRQAGWKFIAFGILAPNVFAAVGILVTHLYSLAINKPFDLGTYTLFAVLCGAASYIAVPAVQRVAIPESSPTLPLAASLGLTFSYNVTVGIPIYLALAKALIHAVPIGHGVRSS